MLGLPTQFAAGALRVLIADPKKAVAVSMALLIRQWGHSARAVFGSFEALETAREYRPNVILMDHTLGPVLTGSQVAQQFRQELGPKLAALVGLAESTEGDRSNAAFDFWLDRPIDPQALEQLLSETTVRRGQRRENTLF